MTYLCDGGKEDFDCNYFKTNDIRTLIETEYDCCASYVLLKITLFEEKS